MMVVCTGAAVDFGEGVVDDVVDFAVGDAGVFALEVADEAVDVDVGELLVFFLC